MIKLIPKTQQEKLTKLQYLSENPDQFQKKAVSVQTARTVDVHVREIGLVFIQ